MIWHFQKSWIYAVCDKWETVLFGCIKHWLSVKEILVQIWEWKVWASQLLKTRWLLMKRTKQRRSESRGERHACRQRQMPAWVSEDRERERDSPATINLSHPCLPLSERQQKLLLSWLLTGGLAGSCLAALEVTHTSHTNLCLRVFLTNTHIHS